MGTPDTTASLQTKIQGKLRNLHKQGKFDKETYKKIYPSVALTPTANPAIKAHKPNKDYPACLITSHIGAPQENLASHINEILKPIIAKNKFACKNSYEFTQKMKTAKANPHEKQTSYDATALFPSVPVSEAINRIGELLKNDTSLHLRTKLTPDEICDLISLCLSSSNFIFDSRHHTQQNSGPIGLSLMVSISQIWMNDTLEKAIALAKTRRVATPRLPFVYMDDIWCLMPHRRPGLRSAATNQADPASEFQSAIH